jgi:hypothetical protein
MSSASNTPTPPSRVTSSNLIHSIHKTPKQKPKSTSPAIIYFQTLITTTRAPIPSSPQSSSSIPNHPSNSQTLPSQNNQTTVLEPFTLLTITAPEHFSRASNFSTKPALNPAGLPSDTIDQSRRYLLLSLISLSLSLCFEEEEKNEKSCWANTS